jgi:PST family polysaccharide transporter
MFKALLTNQKVNLLSLITTQGSSALLPLIIFPYLLTIIGVDAFSKLVISETLSFICLAVVLFGFDIISIKQLTKSKNIIEESLLFSNVFYSRLLLFILVLPLVWIVYIFYGDYISKMYLLWLLIPLGHIFQCAYFFIYKQSNFILAVTTVINRVVALISIFLFINKPEDVVLVPLIIGGSYFVGALFAFTFIIIYWDISLKRVSFRAIITNLKDGFSYFVSNSSVLLYRDLNVLILSIVFKDPIAISIYALAEKTVKSTQAIFRPLSQFYFPKAMLSLVNYSRPCKESAKILWSFTFKQLSLFSLLFIVVISIVLLFKVKLISFFGNSVYDALVFSLPMMSMIYFGISNYMFGMVGLNVLGEEKTLAVYILITGVFNLFLCGVLGLFFGAEGAAFCFVISEIILFTFITKKYLKGEVYYG